MSIGSYAVSLNVTNAFGFSNVTKTGYIMVTRYPTSKFGVFRNGYWYVDWNGNGAWDTVDAQHVGYFGATPGDIPIIGDWDGTGPSKFGVFRNGYWYVDWNGNGAWDTVDAQHVGYFGANPGDIAIIGKWS
jgi:hypothetical protein